MISNKLEKEFNKQINEEIYSAYIYQAMAAYFADESLEGFARWMDVQAQEELEHARKFYDHLNERGGRVKLMAIEAPKHEWESPLSAFEDALEHEEHITGRINKLVDLALAENDHASYTFLQWFVEEQVEEEDSVTEIIDKIKMIGKSGNGLLMLDNKLGSREE
ncbi:MAG: ferritin [Halanaerobiales bacterium]